MDSNKKCLFYRHILTKNQQYHHSVTLYASFLAVQFKLDINNQLKKLITSTIIFNAQTTFDLIADAYPLQVFDAVD